MGVCSMGARLIFMSGEAVRAIEQTKKNQNFVYCKRADKLRPNRHKLAEGNEVADQYAKDAATGRAPREELLGGYAVETSLSHMTRVATEARSRATTEWITGHVRPEDTIDRLLGRALDAPSLDA